MKNFLKIICKEEKCYMSVPCIECEYNKKRKIKPSKKIKKKRWFI